MGRVWKGFGGQFQGFQAHILRIWGFGRRYSGSQAHEAQCARCESCHGCALSRSNGSLQPRRLTTKFSTCSFIVFLAQTPITPAVGYARFLVLPEHISPEPCCIRAIFRARSRSVHYSSNYGLNCVFHEIPKPNSILAIKFHFLTWITTYKKSSVSKLVTWSPLLSCKRAPVVRCSALPIPEGPSET